MTSTPPGTPPGTPPATPSTPASRFVARSPVDLVAMVPIVLGFHPEESVVLMTFGPDGASFHARIDIPRSEAEREEMVETLIAAAAANDVTTAAVVLASADPVAARAAGVDLAVALLAADVDVVDVVRADGERWWSIGPPATDAPTGTTEEGPGTPYDLRCHPFTAERVLDGRAAFRDRGELAESLEPAHTAEADADRAAIARSAAEFAADLLAASGPTTFLADVESARWLRTQVGRLAARMADGQEVPVPVAARICLLARDPVMRDAVCTVLSREGSAEQVLLWSDLVRRAPDHLVEGAASMLALTAWLAGHGALAWCAIDRCHAHAGDDRDAGRALADLVAGLLQSAVSPTRWEPPSSDDVPLLAG